MAPNNANPRKPIDDIDARLNRALALHATVSTTSSNAQAHHTARMREEDCYSKIGAGSCGVIISHDGRSAVLKLAKAGYEGGLWNDYIQHMTIASHFPLYRIEDIRIPACKYFVPADKSDFFAKHPGLAEVAERECEFPTSVLITERIWPLPKATRETLIEKFCAPRLREAARADPANRDCLARVYLGSTRGRIIPMFFSLRNFKLHLNQMIQLQLDVESMAHRMALAMARMHWAALTDARDVEFVLGSSTAKHSTRYPGREALEKLEPGSYTGPPDLEIENFFHRITELWVLDFNQVKPITLDEAGVAQAVQAAGDNDPYLPKPLGTSAVEQSAWNAFAKGYLDESRDILNVDGCKQEVLDLPAKFLEGLVVMQAQRGNQSV